jgi:hypothetical protein
MPRKSRPGMVTLMGAVAFGAADGSNVILDPSLTASAGLVTPYDNMTLLSASLVSRAAGTGGGTCSVRIDAGSTPVSETTANTFVLSTAAAGTYIGYVDGQQNCGAAGTQLKLTTVKTGTFSANITCQIVLIFSV